MSTLPGWAREAALASAAAGATWIAAAIAAEPTGVPSAMAGWVLGAVLGAMQLLRRRHPVAVLVASAVAVVMYHVAGFSAIGMAWPLVVAYLGAGAAGRLRLGCVVAVVLAAGSVAWRGLVEQDGALQVVVSVVQDLGLAALALAVGEALWERRRVTQEVAQRIAATEAAAREESERQLTAQRLEIAADLHDVAGQSLVLIGLQLRLAEETLDRDPAACRRALAAAVAAHTDALRDSAATVRLLQEGDDSEAPRAPGPGLAQLADLVSVAAAADIDLRFDVPPDTRDGVPAAVGLVAYRICQEAVTNTLRHSATARADLSISRSGGLLEVRYLDHGPSRPPGPGTVGGHGIAGMAARAESLGGTLRAGRSGPGHLVEACLPLLPAAES